MKKFLSLFCFLFAVTISAQNSGSVKSPDGSISVIFGMNTDSQPYYLVQKNGKTAIGASRLGLVRKDGDFSKNMTVISISADAKISEHYQMSVGKQKSVSYAANQKTLRLKNGSGQKMDIVFNVSDDGFAFRYVFPETSSDVKYITEEISTFSFKSSAKAWLQPMSKAQTGWEHCHPSYEEYYLKNVAIDTKSPIGQGFVYPVLVKDGPNWIALTEASVEKNYCASHLDYDEKLKAMRVVFPQPEEVFAKDAPLYPQSKLPWETPWRVVALGSLATVVNSTLGTDLSPKSRLSDTSYIKAGPAAWSWGIYKDDGTNYELQKTFIEYASKMRWPYVLIDADWHIRIGMDRIKELVAFGKQKNVKLILWYNSAGDWNTTPYGPRGKFLTAEGRESEFKILEEIGIAGTKIDFFGGDGQSFMQYYIDILEAAARHKIMVNFHGATLPRGWEKTYPNLMTAEAIKGFEFVTFTQEGADLQPEHCATIPFTRNLFDPMDFTPMCLDKIPNINRKTTSAFELALPTLFLSGFQHIAEIPDGMAKMPDYVIEYCKDLPMLWDESRLVSGFPGKDVVMARRRGNDWFVMGINGENSAKEIEVDLSFIGDRNGFMITDAADSLFEKSPVKAGKTRVKMKPYGGFVMKY
ncbi:glycoside hydrolase family 97 catalytic domain-containing protein [Flavobacterium sp. MAH-1]|uniref:Glycoside hydrolase family 97 catalytic domain-containing protein n=1 Tax=Flavobacterium agri TaxID=2743471 RepID=A0A7Y8Y3E4_9FLAO|nr:glycoside hydrolase family 97 protein [Flavobacterium agri]NUY80541.1 glycoside hydrolase family 97 catalytic domain-containing protein [Flavobacterium agri]NYA70565.1 glycoside hydrolase family 97 catalytic domain-containing protein [Flavobacterium agri]